MADSLLRIDALRQLLAQVEAEVRKVDANAVSGCSDIEDLCTSGGLVAKIFDVLMAQSNHCTGTYLMMYAPPANVDQPRRWNTAMSLDLQSDSFQQTAVQASDLFGSMVNSGALLSQTLPIDAWTLSSSTRMPGEFVPDKQPNEVLPNVTQYKTPGDGSFSTATSPSAFHSASEIPAPHHANTNVVVAPPKLTSLSHTPSDSVALQQSIQPGNCIALADASLGRDNNSEYWSARGSVGSPTAIQDPPSPVSLTQGSSISTASSMGTSELPASSAGSASHDNTSSDSGWTQVSDTTSGPSSNDARYVQTWVSPTPHELQLPFAPDDDSPASDDDPPIPVIPLALPAIAIQRLPASMEERFSRHQLSLDQIRHIARVRSLGSPASWATLLNDGHGLERRGAVHPDVVPSIVAALAEERVTQVRAEHRGELVQ